MRGARYLQNENRESIEQFKFSNKGTQTCLYVCQKPNHTMQLTKKHYLLWKTMEDNSLVDKHVTWVKEIPVDHNQRGYMKKFLDCHLKQELKSLSLLVSMQWVQYCYLQFGNQLAMCGEIPDTYHI